MRDKKYGMMFLQKDEISEKVKSNFEDFIMSRHSSRAFSNKEVSEETILEAVRLANFAPSACNRQPIKVYCALGKKRAQDVNMYLSGNKSFTDNVHNFAIITADRANFAGDEQYQWYVNGGIYLGYFVEALHSLGLGSCIMQWFAFSKNEKRLKKLLGIDKSEAIIAVVCLGYYMDNNKYICAQRKEPKETIYFYRD